MLRYKPHLKNQARALRKNMTDSERVFWSRLRGKPLLGVQFDRQKPIGECIVDFYAPATKLVIEVDGSQHLQDKQVAKDNVRDEYLAANGLRVLRFNSIEVLLETDQVVEAIVRVMEESLNV